MSEIPVTWEIGGPVVGYAEVNKDGTAVVTFTSAKVIEWLNTGRIGLSVYSE